MHTVTRRRLSSSIVLPLLALPLALLAGVYIGQAIAPVPAHMQGRTFEIVQELAGNAFIVDFDLSSSDCALLVKRYPGGSCIPSN